MFVSLQNPYVEILICDVMKIVGGLLGSDYVIITESSWTGFGAWLKRPYWAFMFPFVKWGHSEKTTLYDLGGGICLFISLF